MNSKTRSQKKNEEIQIIISHFYPFLNFTEALLHRVEDELFLGSANLCLNKLRESLNKRSTWEIQRDCRKMIIELELHIDELIEKGFIIRILSDYRQLIEKLKNSESELAEVIHQYNMITDEFRLIDTQVEDYVEAIIDSTPAVFGENNIEKRDDYSIEKIMMQAQFLRSDSQ